MSSIIKSNNILEIYELCKNLIDNNNNVLIFLDIDDTVLSSKIGVKFVDKNITQLINLIYSHDSRKLFFLTARDYDLKRKTLNYMKYQSVITIHGYYHKVKLQLYP